LIFEGLAFPDPEAKTSISTSGNYTLFFKRSLEFVTLTSVENIQLAKDRVQGIMPLNEVTTRQQAGEGAPHGDQQVSHR
jgi:hypothetical protein